MSEIKPFDPAELQKRVADTIKGQFAAMIPDAQWDTLVKKEMSAFIEDNGPGTLRGLVGEMMTAECRKKLDVYFSSPEWNSEWDTRWGGNQGAGKKAREFVLENLPSIMADLLAGAVQRGIDTFRNSLSQPRY